MISSNQLVSFIKSKSIHSGFIDQLKVSYRPLICPFEDLINWINANNGSVFDIGCGSGQFALLLAEFTSVKKIAGIEIDERLVNNARELLSPYKEKLSFEFNTNNGKDLPDSIKNYDHIFLIDVLHHIPKAAQVEFLKMVYSKMRTGANLIIKDIDASSFYVLFNKLHDFTFSREIGNELSFKRTVSILNEIGFSVNLTNKRRMYVYPHYTIVCSK